MGRLEGASMSPNQLKRRLLTFCQRRLVAVGTFELAKLEAYMCRLIDERRSPPHRRTALNWQTISIESGVSSACLAAHKATISPALEAIARAARDWTPLEFSGQPRLSLDDQAEQTAERAAHTSRVRSAGHQFSNRLDALMQAADDDSTALHRALVQRGVRIEQSTLISWRNGSKAPRAVNSLAAIREIERYYCTAEGELSALLPHAGRAALGFKINGVSSAEMHRLSWHLPNDFQARTQAEQTEILDWIRTVIIAGSTDYRRYQAAAARQRFGFRFLEMADADDHAARERLKRSDLRAPELLQAEISELVAFKTAALTKRGYRRNGVWGRDTADQKIEHLGLMFGAMAASEGGPLRGLGAPKEHLSLGLLIFPAVWDWYLAWRSAKRGFFTSWETEMLGVAIGLSRKETGWIRQSPTLATNLKPIAGLVTHEEIAAAGENWDAACDSFHEYAVSRARELQRITRVHRDPFEPIMCVLEADSPVGEYLKIASEVRRRIADERLYPRAAAEAVRSFLLIRLGLHLGLRQKNLRQLRLRARGERASTERELADARCGELRWSDRHGGWEVFIPAVAFKNAHSSFFGGKPFRLVLPDLGGLYEQLEAYIDRHRAVLLAATPDPGTFFVKTTKTRSKTGSYDQAKFYEAWRQTIQRYGIYNPYTGRGAIEGLLPHGPHNVRDVLATHILKRTGSYEQASYAIQDTPATVADHYGRFLPQDKAALAAQILNEVWK